MKKLKCLLLAIVLSATFPQLGHPQGSMIWSHSITNSFGTPGILNEANFWLDYETNYPPPGYFEPLFNQISFGTNDVGRTFTIASDADDPDFDAVVNELTDGVDQYIVFYYGNFSTNGIGALNSYSESQLFTGIGTGPDLMGYQIQSFDLHIDSLSIEHPDNNTDFSGQVTLSIYGIPVPEPSSALLILLGSGVLLYARRFHKQL